MGTTMVGMIIDGYGEGAIAEIAEAYRAGASDDEALEAGTGVPADQLYTDFYDAFGVEEPEPIEPAAIGPSDVDKPGGEAAPGSSATVAASGQTTGEDGAPSQPVPMVAIVAIAGAAILGVAGLAAWSARRRAGAGGPS
jgi:hypothetical protein